MKQNNPPGFDTLFKAANTPFQVATCGRSAHVELLKLSIGNNRNLCPNKMKLNSIGVDSRPPAECSKLAQAWPGIFFIVLAGDSRPPEDEGLALSRFSYFFVLFF